MPSTTVDCSQYANDREIVSSFGFGVPVSGSGNVENDKILATFYQENDAVIGLTLKNSGSIVPESVFCLKNLQTLTIENMAFANDIVPDALENLQGLFVLTIRSTPIKTMTAKLSTLSSLNVISILNCSLTELPDLSQIPYLSQLLLSNNQLTEIKGLNSVVFLFLSQNFLTEVPAITNPESVRSMSLNDNRIASVPNFSSFKQLTNVDLRRNLLSTTSIQQARAQILANQPKAKISA